MAREVLLLLDGVEAWRGRVVGSTQHAPVSAQEYFAEAWTLARRDGAVEEDDAGRVQFRFLSTDNPRRET
jgi:hypothetical protein